MWPDLTATTTEDELGPLVSSVTGGRGDLSPGFDYETDRHNREQSAKKAFLKQFNPDIDFDNVNVAPHIDALYQRELEKQQGTDQIAPKADEVWDEGIGTLTVDPDLQRKQDMWNYGLGQMLSRQYPYVGGDPWSDEAPYDKRHPNTLREMLDSMSETERDYVQHGGIGSDAVNSLIENLGGFNLQATDWMNEGGGSYAKYLENMKERFGPHTRVRKDEMLRQMLPKYPRKEGFFEKLPFHSGPFDFNFQSEKQLPWKYGDLFNLFTPDYNKGGIASLQSGGQPGPFSDSTTVTDEEIIDIQPLQMDPGIMGIGDLEDLFEEAKVKESIYDKLKYVNNTMHG